MFLSVGNHTCIRGLGQRPLPDETGIVLTWLLGKCRIVTGSEKQLSQPAMFLSVGNHTCKRGLNQRPLPDKRGNVLTWLLGKCRIVIGS